MQDACLLVVLIYFCFRTREQDLATRDGLEATGLPAEGHAKAGHLVRV